MYVIKNAFKNLIRNKGRNMLIGIIVLAMISTVAISTIINNTTNSIINSYKSRFGSEVIISPNIEKLREAIINNPEQMNYVSNLSISKTIEFSNSNYLKEVKAEASMQGIARNIKGVNQEKYEKNTVTNSTDIVVGGNSDNTNIHVKSYTENNYPKEFKDGLIQLTSGKMAKNKNEVIIGEELAKINNLKIGDMINVEDPSGQGKVLNLKVSGIFKDFRTVELGYITSQDTRNEIFTTFETMKEYDDTFPEDSSDVIGNMVFFLNSPDDLEGFTKELRSKGLDDIFDVRTDESSYNKIVAPVNGLKKVSTMFMVGVTVFGVVVLAILSVLSIRERKYEIGVLRAMGMSKGKLITSFIAENMAIIMICLTLGLGISSLSSQPVANTLLNEQVKVVKQQEENMMNAYLPTTDSNEDVEELNSLEVRLTPKTALQISAFAIVLGLLTSSVAVLYVTKYEPIKILQERN